MYLLSVVYTLSKLKSSQDQGDVDKSIKTLAEVETLQLTLVAHCLLYLLHETTRQPAI